MRTVALGLGLVVGVGWSLPCAAEPDAPSLTLSPWIETRHTDGDRAGQVTRSRQIRFGSDAAAPALQWREQVDAKGVLLKGELGYSAPTDEGWYSGGFLSLDVGGKSLDAVPLAALDVAEVAPRPTADLVWRLPAAVVRLRAWRAPGDDRLWLQVAVDAGERPPPAVVLHLLAYPSFFTSWYKRPGARRVRLPQTTLVQGARAVLKPAQATWAVLYDEQFDPAKGPSTKPGEGFGHGPCAVWIDPAALSQATLQVGDYAVTLDLVLQPRPTTTLALWKFADRPNAEVLARFPGLAEQTAATAAAVDPTPGRLKSLDTTALAACLQAARAKPAVVAALGARLDEAERWLAQLGQTAPGLWREHLVLAGAERVDGISWEAKLAQLLDF